MNANEPALSSQKAEAYSFTVASKSVPGRKFFVEWKPTTLASIGWMLPPTWTADLVKTRIGYAEDQA